MWDEGSLEITCPDGTKVNVEYSVKHYENGSYLGIDNGRISKLQMRIMNEIVLDYDCKADNKWVVGLDKSNFAIMSAYRKILKKYN